MSLLEFTLTGTGNISNSIHKNISSVVLSYPCSDFSSCSEFYSILPKGIFLLEVWGGDGGHRLPALSGSPGGYSRGILTLNEPTEVFFAIGAKGGYPSTDNVFSQATYNGGGRSCQSGNYIPSNGGGGTDIRVLSNDIYHRIIVAGGGGGTGSQNSNVYQGGHGGGLNGGNGVIGSDSCDGGKGGLQEDGGPSAGSYSLKGTFGYGGTSTSTGRYGCGGGGGWFGGSCGNGGAASGGGGSGYVLTSISYLPLGYAFNHTSSYILRDAFSISSGQYFPRPHFLTGNGCILVTILSQTCNKSLKCIFIYHLIASFYIIGSSCIILAQ